MSERDKYLTEAMGGCYHQSGEPSWVCRHCGVHAGRVRRSGNPDFSVYSWFGELKEYINTTNHRVEFWDCYIRRLNDISPRTADIIDKINPDSLADFYYEFLKGRNQ